jgi:hypothetical protein
MGVIFTAEAEQRRTEAMQENRAKKSASWEYLTTFSLVEATHFARDMGWQKKKVQVRATRINESEWEYTVEPFEKDCSCPNILKFKDYFDPSRDQDED